MQPQLDHDAMAGGPIKAGLSRAPSRPSLPDIHDRPRRRTPTMVVAGVTLLAAGAAFYAAEAFLPRELRPSTFIGGYQTEIAEATKAGELSAQIRYDAQLRNLELVYQDGLQRIQTAGVQWQEECRAGLTNVNNLYQAIYTRANTYVQATAQLQQSYQAMRQQITANTFGGETGLINMATTFAPFIALVDPNAARQLSQYAATARRSILSAYDRESRTINAITVRGWDTGLPPLGALGPMVRCDMPAFVTGVPANPVRVPPPPITTPRR